MFNIKNVQFFKIFDFKTEHFQIRNLFRLKNVQINIFSENFQILKIFKFIYSHFEKYYIYENHI